MSDFTQNDITLLVWMWHYLLNYFKTIWTIFSKPWLSEKIRKLLSSGTQLSTNVQNKTEDSNHTMLHLEFHILSFCRCHYQLFQLFHQKTDNEPGQSSWFTTQIKIKWSNARITIPKYLKNTGKLRRRISAISNWQNE